MSDLPQPEEATPHLYVGMLTLPAAICYLLILLSLLSQVYHDSEEGQRYIQFYKLNKFPYISILDPRTGESFWQLGEGCHAARLLLDVL